MWLNFFLRRSDTSISTRTVFLKPVPNSRVTECRDQISIALKQPGIRGSLLATRIEWFLADERTRSINPTSSWTVPSFLLSTISWRRSASGHARDLVTLPKKKALEEAYELDPAFPLIHLALASVEADPERAAFLRDFDLKRLPDSCSYTTDLDPAEITLEAAEMCAEQKDWPRALVALDKYAKVGKPNSRSDALRAQAEKSQSPEQTDSAPQSWPGVSSLVPVTLAGAPEHDRSSLHRKVPLAAARELVARLGQDVKLLCTRWNPVTTPSLFNVTA